MKNKVLKLIITLCIVIFHNSYNVFGQATSAVGTNLPLGADYLGWAAPVVIPLDIRHNNGINGWDIDFYRGPAPINQLGKIQGLTGFFGLGDPALGTVFGPLFPKWRLDVDVDDINLNTHFAPTPFFNSGYRYNDNLVLYLPGDAPGGGLRNTFVGRSGNPSAAPGNDNTYTGYEAGLSSSGQSKKNVLEGVGAGRANTATGSTFIGYEAGLINTNGDFNTAVGCSTAYNNTTGGLNAFFGKEAGFTNSTAHRNTFMGTRSGFTNSTGTENAFVGFESGFSNTVNANTFIGAYSGRSNSVGLRQTYVGWNSGLNSTVNSDNTFIGYDCASQNINGEANTFVGSLAARLNKGSYNTFVGQSAGAQQASLNTNSNTFIGTLSGLWNQASQNSFLGDLTGELHNTGNYNTYIGSRAQFIPTTIIDPLNNLQNSAAIGANSTVVANDQMILGGINPLNGNLVRVGIGMSAVPGGMQNMLEINTPLASPTTNNPAICGGVAQGASGLRFRDLTSASAPCPSTGKVLTVDGNGDVILVPDGGAAFGLCSAGGPTILAGHSGVDFNEWNVYFQDPAAFPPGTKNNGMAIGYSCGTVPLAGKLDVQSITATTGNYTFTHKIAGNFYETGSYTLNPAVDEFVGVMGKTDVTHPNGNRSINIGGDFYALNADGANIGARGTGTGPGNGPVFGLWGNAINHTAGVGVEAYSNCTVTNIGLEATATNGTGFNYGVSGIAIPPGPIPGVFDVGVYGYAPTKIYLPTLNYAIYGDLGPTVIPCPAGPPIPPCAATAPDYAGYFNGDVGSTTGFWVTSDASLKTNIQDISDPMLIINQLNPKSYYFDQQQNASMVLPSDIHYGLLAQDLYNVLPQLTKDCIHPARYDSSGNQTYAPINFKAINYSELIPFLIAAIKEQQTQIEALQSLQPQMHQHPDDNGEGNGNSIDVNLSSKTIVLNQNVPNPFKEETTIEYFIPDDAQQVKIIFTDNKGSVLKEVEIPEKGKGQLNVYAADLSSGIYTYTIVADGVTIDTKQMVKTK